MVAKRVLPDDRRRRAARCCRGTSTSRCAPFPIGAPGELLPTDVVYVEAPLP